VSRLFCSVLGMMLVFLGGIESKPYSIQFGIPEVKVVQDIPAETFATSEVDNAVFVILTHIRNENDNAIWKRCYTSIREFYSDVKIVIIDDNSNFELLKDGLYNTTIIKSEYPGAGELLPYYYFLKYKWADKMIFVHDSMFMIRKFSDFELTHNIKFHWHFEEHCWDDDKTIDRLLGYLKNGNELIEYNYQKSSWKGCFGVASIIDLSTLKNIESKYSFTSSLVNEIKSREARMALERVFAIIIFKEGYVIKKDCSNFGSIFDSPVEWGRAEVDDSFLENLKLTHPSALLKTWHGR